ncbi:glycosyltransferase family 4 protein [Dokdonia sp. Hel_I_53]|uniref:glycosyltransferase family 4 protein n=1 Tax=Dokdonia sp. Hel_I_53 TaxID=1566287 RepID=UPI00119B37DE|nr:glycosyltransferase family 4 protein [Dokdonia sp. Hel_I_53]TVZ52667.1 glycosyltransferase involved in cell wall biosynthesis [Dokdonia sp. Hel_I_53]
MHIAQIHNEYKDLGGEDVVVAREKELLENAGHSVSQYIVSNKNVDTLSRKLKTAISLPYSYDQKDKMLAFLKVKKPEVVHVHNFLPILSPSVFYACKEVGVPVVLTIHNYRLICSNGLLYRDGNVCEKCISKKWGFPAIKHGCYQDSSITSIFPVLANGIHSSLDTWSKYIDKVIFLTEFSQNIFKRSHIQFTNEQMIVKPNFVKDRGYSYEKEDYFLYVGRLSEEKGIIEIVNAFIDSGKPLRIAGEGPLSDMINTKIEKYPHIKLLGFQNQDELSELYLKAKALVTGSKMYETFGLIIIEAFSFGTPVIAPNFGNVGSLVTTNIDGVLYDHLDASSLQESFEKFDFLDQEKLRKNARATFEKNFTSGQNLNQLEAIYKSVL